MFMFCAKTNIGYFNYIHFVRLFPLPSFKNLYILLIISFIFSIIAVVFVIGFNSNSSCYIININANKICWFERPATYYFLAIPVCIFLSSISQEIGWLTGPLILVVGDIPGEILTWSFNFCNELEDLWSILLYIIIRKKNMDEQKQVIATKELLKRKHLTTKKHKKNQ
ncbi:unnamed protein product [Rotaria sp. Silwood2]|nr:unnamed protein product [Rotaria sp. Silwood2]CAF2691030.1 unnamed protein product [Rotaria sp. Silwood2]CAF2939161.1 unnamed protein product [Rotaria sp. Silwood2]CAF3083784.1 unnamed protein product [Rotaria sp. Silwood2]CAF3858924.1 unnamed protein product [Rotaria sp. Silwood2]